LPTQILEDKNTKIINKYLNTNTIPIKLWMNYRKFF
jgi:hypothetical protein